MNHYISRGLLSVALAAGLTLPGWSQEKGQVTFNAPQEAVQALIEATSGNDEARLAQLFGPSAKSMLGIDTPEVEARRRAEFSRELAEHNVLVEQKGATYLMVGSEGWPFPIPLKQKAGKWYFDTVEGADELVARRVGENELNAMNVCRAIAEAEQEYATRDWDGDGVREFAQALASAPGKRNGLFWPDRKGQPESPLGPLVAQAQSEGYAKPGQSKAGSYHGYHFKILTSQGASAPGGAHSYVINGNMIAGYAVLAWPVTWGKTGIKTFLLSNHGTLYERNLGANTATIIPEIQSFNPGPGWTAVKE